MEVGVVPPRGWRQPRDNTSTVITIVTLVFICGLTIFTFFGVQSSRSAARAAQQRALAQLAAAQAATQPSATMPNSVPSPPATQPFAMPPPLNVEQVTAMSKEEARAALFQRALAEQHADRIAIRSQLSNDRRMLIEHLKGEVPTSQPSSPPLAPLFVDPAGPPPEPITQDDIDTMTKEQARSALYRRAVAEKYVSDPALKDRLTKERRMLIDRLKKRNL